MDVEGNPPDVAQFNMGADINNLVDSGLLANLDDVANIGEWSAVVPKSVMDAVTRDGRVYAVPIQLQATNFLFASKTALDKVGADMPKTWGEFFATGVVTGDVWAMPLKNGAPNEAQKQIAKLATSVEVQTKFTTAMGSLPIRSGVDSSGYNACAVAGAKAIEGGNSVSALMISFSPEKVGASGSEIKVLWAKPDATADDYVNAIAGVLEHY